MRINLNVFISTLFVAGCATAPPPAQLATVQLCYELVTGEQRRGAAVFQEIQRRGENCDKYQNQVTMMIQAETQRRAAVAAAIMSINATQKSNQQSVEDAYWGPQKARQNAPINCTSQPGLGGVVNTTCR
jgi:hypothetical protein